MLQDLKEAIDGQLLKLYDKATVNELFTFIISKTGKPQAEQNTHDDLVMSLAIAWQLYQLVPMRYIQREEERPSFTPRDSVIGV